MTEAALYAFLLVFLRCSAMLVSSPVFGAQSTPLPVRIWTTVALAGALTMIVQPGIGRMPADAWLFVMAVLQEIAIGVLIGSFLTLALQAAQVAGAFMDLQVGLGMSQTLNPLNGVSVTVLAQFKFMLAVVVFLSLNGHHLAIEAVLRSYQDAPALGLHSLTALKDGLLTLVTSIFLLALQISAPVLGVTLVVDAGLGIVNRAVPQMQAIQVGMPAKVGIGLLGVAIGLPALTAGVNAAVNSALTALRPALGG